MFDRHVAERGDAPQPAVCKISRQALWVAGALDCCQGQSEVK